MRIIFDKNTQTERQLVLDNLTERPLDNRIVGSRTIPMAEGGTVPDLSGFIGHRSFSTVEVVSGDLEIPLTGEYNFIADLSGTYIEQDDIYIVNLTVTKVDEEE